MQEVIANVWSFKDSFQQIPYRITRIGMTKRDGGSGIHLKCSCPHAVIRKATCKHLTAFREAIRAGTILTDDRFLVSEYGKSILGLVK